MQSGAIRKTAGRIRCRGWIGALALTLAACTTPATHTVVGGAVAADAPPTAQDADSVAAAPTDVQDVVSPAICTSCVSSEDCGADQHCAQVGGSAYCLASCGDSGACAADSSCTTVADAAGNQVQVCIPSVAPCGAVDPAGEDDAAPAPGDSQDVATEPDSAAQSVCPGYADPTTPACCVCGAGKTCSPNGCYNGWLCNVATCKCNPAPDTCGGGTTDAGSSVPDTSGPAVCGALDGPSVASCCACKPGKTCAANHCYDGWYCNHDSCSCQPPPAPGSCPAPIDASGGPDLPDSAAPDAGGEPTSPDQVDNSGGTLSSLDFAIVGDTRPPVPNLVNLYPTAIITKIWQGVQAEQPPLSFAITTGDYIFSTKNSSTAAPQFDLYLAARAKFAGKVFYALGNHECTGATASNCGAGNADGETGLFNTFKAKLLAQIGKTQPYYALKFKAADGKWTAKFVVIAANAWDATQAAWLDQALAEPTTYTFVVRHEGDQATEAPGVLPSAAIFAKYPYTLLIAGHTHTYAHYASKREFILGTGGAPLATAVNYSYGVVRQLPNMMLDINVYDYTTHAVLGHFVIAPNGTLQP